MNNKFLTLCILSAIISNSALAATTAPSNIINDSAVTNTAPTNSIIAGNGANISTTALGAIAIGTNASTPTNPWYSDSLSNKLKREYATTNAIAIGTNATSVSQNSVSLGVNAKALQENSVAMGPGAQSQGWNTIAIGNGAIVKSDFDLNVTGKNEESLKSKGAIAIGDGASSYQQGAISFGQNTVADGQQAIAIGTKANASNALTVSIGAQSKASDAGASAFGALAKADAYGATAIGDNSTVTNTYGSALGLSSHVTGEAGTAVGTLSEATGKFSTSSGYLSLASGEKSVASGYNMVASGIGSVAIGSSSANRAGWTNRNYANNTVENASGAYSVVVGTDGFATAKDAIAIGHNAVANDVNSVALGANSTTSSAVATQGMNINGTYKTFAGIAPVGTVSVGSSGEERTITNVAAGRISDTSTDAINGSQLYAVASELRSSSTYTSGVATTIDGNNAINVNYGKGIHLENNQLVTDVTKDDITSINNSISNNSTRIDNLFKTANATAREVEKVGAMSAAMANLHPLDFDPDSKLSIAVAGGFYKSEKAAAIGLFYRPNEDTQFNISASLGNGNNMYGFGTTLKIGQGNDSKLYNKYKTAPISTVYVLENKIEQLEKEHEKDKLQHEQDRERISKLESLVQQLMENK